MQGLLFQPCGGQRLFDIRLQRIDLPPQALLFLPDGRHTVLDLALQAVQLPEQALLFLPCGGQLLFEFIVCPRGTRLESLYQALPDMLDGPHRNDLPGAMLYVVVILLLLWFELTCGLNNHPQ
jgi:hypothetical protein